MASISCFHAVVCGSMLAKMPACGERRGVRREACGGKRRGDVGSGEARYVFAPAMCEIADAHAIAPMSWAMIETANSDGVTGVMSP